MSASSDDQRLWLFDRRTDLLAFGGSFLASLLLLALGKALGLLDGDLPLWGWILTVVLIDVAHVWSTGYRVYFDLEEVKRRRGLYLGLPIALYLGGVALHLGGPLPFWRALAYVAVFHFVRQQYGWVALYRRRAGDDSRLDRWLDTATIYGATLFPIVWWHAHLPRRFHWFMPGDFLPILPAGIVAPLHALHFALLGVYLLRQLQRAISGTPVCWGKQLVVLSTWCCWYGGIVLFDSDYAFTVTNVVIHGVPYFVLTWRYGQGRFAPGGPRGKGFLSSVFAGPWIFFYLLVAALALVEETLWDRYIWQERADLFGDWGVLLTGLSASLLVPLLALPQAVHYALDGFVWRVSDKNPELGAALRLSRPASTQTAGSAESGLAASNRLAGSP